MTQGEHRKREKRILLSDAEDAVIAEVIEGLGESLNVRLTFSDIARCAIFLLSDAMPRLLRKVPTDCELRRPPTRSPEKVEEFERVLRQVLLRAFNDGALDELTDEERRLAFSERFRKRLEGRDLDEWLEAEPVGDND